MKRPKHSPGELGSARTAQIVHELVARSSRRAELIISLGRALFASAVLVRFLVLEHDLNDAGSTQRALIELPVLGVTMALSVALAGVALRRGISQRLLDMSVVLDALACCLTLLPGVASSGGRLQLENRPGGGALASVLFTVAAPGASPS